MAASRILVGHDGSPRAGDALALGRLLAQVMGADLLLARVVPWEPLPLQALPFPGLKNRYEHEERAALKELQEVADRAGASAEAGPGESPAQGLQLLAEELNPDIVVVGSSHRDRIGRVLAGNVALRLLNGLHRPVAVAPAGYANRTAALQSIGVGFDGSPESHAALQAAGDLALAADAKVWVMGVAEPYVEAGPHPWAFAWSGGAGRVAVEERLRGSLESAAGSLPIGVTHTAKLFRGGPVAVLTDEAQTVDLLVLGSRAYGPARRVLLGSVSGPLVRHAPCPVLVVPRPGSRESEEQRAGTSNATRA
jgi:nucleotide-binding universal stress UspA family protein